MKNKQRNITIALLILIILENLFLYYFFRNGILTQGKNAIGLFLTSVMFGTVVIYKFYNGTVAEEVHIPAKNKKFSYLIALLLAAGLVILGTQYNVFFHSRPVSIESSDIIPSIQIMCKRLLTGKYPYDLFYDFGFPQMPTYLPMQWMPFTIAELLHIDYRWIPYTAWCIAAVWLCVRGIKTQSPLLKSIIPLVIFASNYVLFSSSNKGIVEASIELLISAYYIMFISGLNQKNGILQGLIISFCLLSRYSLVLWMPLYCFILFVTKKPKTIIYSFSDHGCHRSCIICNTFSKQRPSTFL